MRLLELREERNLTQNDIAEAINTSRTNIGRWEKGLNEPPASLIISLADFFEVSTDFLLGRSDDFGNINVKKESPELTSEDLELLNDFHLLPSTLKAQAQEYVHYLAERQKTIKKEKA